MSEGVSRWLARDPDPETRAELQALVDGGDHAEIERRFSGRLEFGTAGLRGVVGAGPGMMNALVIRETSAGLARYLNDTVPGAAEQGIVVAYDGRLDSQRFARDAACVFAAVGLRVYVTPAVAATPVAAFGVLALDACAGVVVTASHNPPEYNGYKVYWGNGAQIIPPHDAGIAAAIEEAAAGDLPWVDFESGQADGLIIVLGEDFYTRYADGVLGSEIFSRTGEHAGTSIAYTAMHGVGAELAETMLARAGFGEVYSVASQRDPDGSFPTVNFPNPEEPGAMDAVIALAQEHDTTLACANDPDADRLAVAAKTAAGEYQMLTGDMVGVLLADYLLRKPNQYQPIVCTTIVSSSMLGSVARVYGAQYHETLTGFKWLANVALDHEDDEHRFLFAYEEALGYACGRQVFDKDGLSALLAFAQMTDTLLGEGKTVFDQLESLYRRHGIFLTAQRSLALQPGTAGPGVKLRASPPRAIAGNPVATTEDLQACVRRGSDGSEEDLSYPASDVLIFRLENDSRIIVRPSGTEPKVKCYYEVLEPVAEDEPFDIAMARAQSALEALVEKHQQEIV